MQGFSRMDRDLWDAQDVAGGLVPSGSVFAFLAEHRRELFDDSGDPLLPFRLIDEWGGEVEAVAEFLHHMLADDASPASLRSYAYELLGVVPRGPDQPVWWTQRRPVRALEYDAARMVFTRVNRLLGSNWTLHDLRHSAAKGMVRDPDLTLADVQWVLGHAHLSTTEIYTAPTSEEVIARVLAHHERARTQQAAPPPSPAPGYRPDVLAVLFGTWRPGNRTDDRNRPRRDCPRDRDRGGCRGRLWEVPGVGAPVGSGQLVADPPGQGGVG